MSDQEIVSKAVVALALQVDPGNPFVETLKKRLAKRGHLTVKEIEALGRVTPTHQPDMPCYEDFMEQHFSICGSDD